MSSRSTGSLVSIEGRTFAKGYTLSDTETVDLLPGSIPTGAANVQAVAHSGDVEIRLVKQANGSDQQVILLDTLNGSSIDQANELRISEQANTLLRLKNVSGSEEDYIVIGKAIAP
jgi:hypothetical protein